VPYLKKGGIFHIYVYGKSKKKYSPKIFVSSFLYYLYRFLTLNQRAFLTKVISKLMNKSPHSLFDAYSPPIQYRFTPAEVEKWFRECGFCNIKRTYPKWCRKDEGIHMNGEKIKDVIK
jgi:hypothetical protein